MATKRFTFCLRVRGFTRSPISEALAVVGRQDVVGPHCIVNTKTRAVGVAEIKFCKVAVPRTHPRRGEASHNEVWWQPDIDLA